LVAGNPIFFRVGINLSSSSTFFGGRSPELAHYAPLVQAVAEGRCVVCHIRRGGRFIAPPDRLLAIAIIADGPLRQRPGRLPGGAAGRDAVFRRRLARALPAGVGRSAWLTQPRKRRRPTEMERMLRQRCPFVTEDEMRAAFFEAVERLQCNIDALGREREELQRFGDEVHAIAAETGIAMHPKTPFGRVLKIAAGHGNARQGVANVRRFCGGVCRQTPIPPMRTAAPWARAAGA
jgi:hypothetical protein